MIKKELYALHLMGDAIFSGCKADREICIKTVQKNANPQKQAAPGGASNGTGYRWKEFE